MKNIFCSKVEDELIEVLRCVKIDKLFQDQLSTRRSFISGIVSLGVVISTLLALRELIYEAWQPVLMLFPVMKRLESVFMKFM